MGSVSRSKRHLSLLAGRGLGSRKRWLWRHMIWLAKFFDYDLCLTRRLSTKALYNETYERHFRPEFYFTSVSKSLEMCSGTTGFQFWTLMGKWAFERLNWPNNCALGTISPEQLACCGRGTWDTFQSAVGSGTTGNTDTQRTWTSHVHKAFSRDVIKFLNPKLPTCLSH